MKKIFPLLGFVVLLFANLGRAGDWTPNEFFYKIKLGARGSAEKNAFDTALDRVDARLGKEYWVGDPLLGSTFQSALTYLGSNQAVLHLPRGTHSIAADLTVPANITLAPEREAVLSIATTKTLTINGTLEAGPWQIFSCTGTGKVVFGSSVTVYPEWWGAVGNGATDDRVAIQAALDCLVNGVGGTAVFSGKTYRLNSWNPTITPGYSKAILAVYDPSLGGYKTVKLVGRDGATLTTSLVPTTENMSVLLTLLYNLQDVEIRGLTFAQTHGVTTKETCAIDCIGWDDFQIKYPKITDCRFKNFSRAVNINSADSPVVEKCTFTSDLGRDSGSSSNPTAPNVGIWAFPSVRNIKVVNNHFDGCLAASVAGNTAKTALDGFVLGNPKGFIIEGNTIINFGYEGIFVMPPDSGFAPGDNNHYPAIICGNRLDAKIVPGSDVLSNYAIRCDESYSMVSNNTITNATRGVLIQRETAYNTDIYGIKIFGNNIMMQDSSANSYYGILAGVNTHDVEIQDNQITWPSYINSDTLQLQGISVAGVDSRIIANKIKALVKTGTNPLYGIWINNNCERIFLDGNETVNCDYGIYLSTAGGGPQGIIEVVRHTFTNCTHNFGGNLGNLLWRNQ